MKPESSRCARLVRALAASAAVSLLPSILSAQTTWTGAGGDTAWSNPANWNNGVPDANDASAALGAGTTIMIGNGVSAVVGTSTTDGTIFGPEWGGTLDIHGSLAYRWYLAPIGAADNPSEINLFAGASITGEGIALGSNWWFNDAPWVTMTTYESSSVDINFFFWGGELNLFGGTFATGGVNTADAGNVSDATRRMNITAGTLILEGGDFTNDVNGWITRGILVAYDGTGSIQIDTVSSPGNTIVTAAIPEPSALALPLLAIVAAASLARRRR